MATKKKTITAASLQSKSELAITAFRSLISGLKATNEEGAAARADNEAQIAMLQQENDSIAAMTEKNNKIVQNIENLLSV